MNWIFILNATTIYMRETEKTLYYYCGITSSTQLNAAEGGKMMGFVSRETKIQNQTLRNFYVISNKMFFNLRINLNETPHAQDWIDFIATKSSN